MVLLSLFAFLGGVFTVLSPCALPLLPILLSGSTGRAARSWGIVTGFVGGFTAFTLGVTVLVQAVGFPAEALRLVAGALVVVFGVVTLVPAFQSRFQRALAQYATPAPRQPWKKPGPSGYGSGVVLGLSLGLAWSPCVGPIMASVLTLALSQTVTWATTTLTLLFALGTALPLLAVMAGGRALLQRVPWLTQHAEGIQRAFAVLMIATGIALLFGWDRDLQAAFLRAFPGYASALTGLEHQGAVLEALDQLGS